MIDLRYLLIPAWVLTGMGTAMTILLGKNRKITIGDIFPILMCGLFGPLIPILALWIWMENNETPLFRLRERDPPLGSPQPPPPLQSPPPPPWFGDPRPFTADREALENLAKRTEEGRKPRRIIVR